MLDIFLLDGDNVVNWQTPIPLIGISLGSDDDVAVEIMDPDSYDRSTERNAYSNYLPIALGSNTIHRNTEQQ